jgi:tRNA(fMet)-specific endonuclease VapC
MRRFVLDTGIAAMYMDRRSQVYERAKREQASGNLVGITSQILSELATRAEGSEKRDRNLARLRQALDSWKLWMPTIESSFEYGRIHLELRRLGRPIGQNDMMIASVARRLHNCVVVSADGDFKLIPGLHVENWAEDKS